MENNLKDQIRKMISQIGEVEMSEVGDETHLVMDLRLDSLQALELLAELESKYNLKIPQEYLPKFTSVNNLASLVTELRAQ